MVEGREVTVVSGLGGVSPGVIGDIRAGDAGSFEAEDAGIWGSEGTF